MHNANYLELKNAFELNSFIKRNERKIYGEKVLGFYTVEDLGGYSTQPIIFEFESYVAQIKFCYDSILEMVICDRESFYNGEITRHFYGTPQIQGEYQPFKEPNYAMRLHKRIQKIEIETKKELTRKESLNDKNFYYEGNGFYKIILVFDDERFVIYPQNIDSVKYMYYEFEN